MKCSDALAKRQILKVQIVKKNIFAINVKIIVIYFASGGVNYFGSRKLIISVFVK